MFRPKEKGKIFIDWVLTSEFGLHDLRQKISIIPQEPVLFTDSTRKNSSSRRVWPEPSRGGTASRSSSRPRPTWTPGTNIYDVCLHDRRAREPVQRMHRAHRLNTIIDSDRIPVSPLTHIAL
ncbi:multidrug resistance-associated protein 4-like [Sebastes umbrosus]|uniref:multidrug resistance-associated protein 4-like n=1 Tax=Sebastes umbrosus TaxID=72105 RepID=UPI00189DD3C9|nr:multidrug resistance-associated protein 4-like [Sebastes umbrosus]